MHVSTTLLIMEVCAKHAVHGVVHGHPLNQFGEMENSHEHTALDLDDGIVEVVAMSTKIKYGTINDTGRA
jgi:hypothetical protein